MKWKSTIYLEILVLSNLFPVYCIYRYHWPFFSVLWLYWLECFLLIIFDVSRILVSEKNETSVTHRSFIKYKIKKAVQLFLFRLFMLLFYLVFMIFFIAVRTEENQLSQLISTIGFQNKMMNIALVCFVVSNYYGYIFYFIANNQYRQQTPAELFKILDYRNIVLHLVIVIGILANQVFGNPPGQKQSSGSLIFLVVFIAIKTIAELIVYQKNKKNGSGENEVAFI